MKALEIKNVYKSFGEEIQALKNISFEIESGEFCVIAGSNGSGKSVLMTLISKLDLPTEGEINIFDNSVGLVFQDADAQILGETPEEDVAFGAKNCGLKKQELKDCIDSSLLQVGLLDKKNFSARTLSGGEKRRLAVAGVLAMNKSIIIFDEPFANLDWPSVKQVCNILKKLKSQNKTIIVLTHELEKVLALADRFIILDKGEIQFNGKPQDGLKLNLENYSIKNPLSKYNSLEDLVWL